MRIILKVVEVGGIARDEIIDADDAKALRQKTVRQVTAEKSGPSRNNCGFHEGHSTSLTRFD
jgi:hypothetical protein